MKIMDYIKFKVRIMAKCMNIWGKKEIDIVNDEYSCYIDYLFQSFLQLSFLFSLKVVMDYTLFIGIVDKFRTDHGVFWRMFSVKMDFCCRDIWHGINGNYMNNDPDLDNLLYWNNPIKSLVIIYSLLSLFLIWMLVIF